MECLVTDQPAVWQSRVSRFLEEKTNTHFVLWAKSHNWQPTRRKPSPYQSGYARPEWMDQLIDAINRGDENDAKGIMLQNL